MWCCRRCCVRSRRHPGSRDGGAGTFDQLRTGVRAQHGYLVRRSVAVGLAGCACVAVFMWLGVQVASSAQVYSSSPPPIRTPARAPVRTPVKTPSRSPASSSSHAPAANNAPAAKSPPSKGPAQAPSKPPLGTGSGAGTGANDEAEASVSTSGGDPLVENGLGSPFCSHKAVGELSAEAASACRISHFDASAAPTGDYGFDVHINTGVADISNDVDAEVLNGVQWSWTLLVAVVHGVIVMLEWCYSFDLFHIGVIGRIAQRLRQTRTSFTQPWLELALVGAAVLALYHGIIRRRVAQTLGEVVLMSVMMMGGLWVIINPLGTIGALDEWANEASMGTLAAVASGTPENSGATLEESMQSVFSGTVGGPWCYMEFGNVGWCRGLDPSLEKAAQRIAAQDQATIGVHGAELLRSAKTNRELFLALPANGAQRNSINDYGPFKNEVGLFQVLCGSSEEPCQGPTASEAEFRTGSGTLWRIGGLCLFWIGVLGMVLVLGFIGIRLLVAALFSMFYLLLAPAAVIAPALGDGGRAAFRKWGTRLLGAVCSKLIYSFLLGIVLLMQSTVMSLPGVGWAAQWALVSTMWWWLFIKRHEVNGFVHDAHGGGAGAHHQEHRSLLRRTRERAQNPPELVRAGKWVKNKLKTSPPSVEQRRKRAQAGLKHAKGIADGQVKRSLEREYGEAQALVRTAPETEARISAKQAQLERMQGEHATAQGKAADAGKRKAALSNRKGHPSAKRKSAADKLGVEEQAQRERAADLRGQMGRLQGEIASDRDTLAAAQRTVEIGAQAKQTGDNVYTRAQAERRGQFLDAQAALPAGERDYAAAAGIANYGRRQYEALDDSGKQAARKEIDQELAVRKGAGVAAREVAAVGEGSLEPREQKKVEKQFGQVLEQEVNAEGHELPISFDPRTKRSGFEAGVRDWQAAGRPNGRSRVMRDAHEVMAGRKRQLGGERRR